MKQYQRFLERLSRSGEIGKNSDGEIGISLPSYVLEYKFKKEKKRKICGEPSSDGFHLITNTPNIIISDLLSSINSLPIDDFEDFNRIINNFGRSGHHIGNFKNGKNIELPFLKKPYDFRVPTCKIIEPPSENNKKYGCLDLEITLYNYEVLWELPKCLDAITIFYCILCITTGYNPNSIRFTLVRPFCKDRYLGELDLFTSKNVPYKAMRIKPTVTNFLNVKTGDIEFSL